jgi:hypothetical protein
VTVDEQELQAHWAAVLDGIGRVAGAEVRDETDALWQEHAARERTEVTVLGPYSSGKTTVLRRLLAEAGVELPEWLTVSARRETFELNEIDAGELTYTDAPGFAAGNELHSLLADDALSLSDAFLLVVPPQLLTSNRADVGAVLSGEHFFGRPGGRVAQATVAVIAQADTLGPDPQDDLEEMLKLAERKREELRHQLTDAGAGDLRHLAILAVAADPYEEQAHEVQPEASAFDEFREWDGIDRLQEALGALAGERDALRADAQLRFAARMGRMVHADGAAVLEEITAAAADLESRHKQVVHLQTRTRATVEAARADLAGRIVAMGAELSDELSAADADGEAKVQARLEQVVERWARQWDGEADLLLSEAEVEVDRRLARPGAQRTGAFLRSLLEPRQEKPQDAPNSRIIRVLNDIHDDLNKTTRSAFEAKLGGSLEQLAKSAAKVKHPKTGGNSASAGIAQRAGNVQAGLQIADGILNVVVTIDQEVQQGKLDAELARRRELARDRIQRAADELADEVVGQWRVRLDDGSAQLANRLGVTAARADLDGLTADIEDRRRSLDALQATLDSSPALFGH